MEDSTKLTNGQIEQLCKSFYIETTKKNHGADLRHISDVTEGFRRGLMVARVIYESKGNQKEDK